MFGFSFVLSTVWGFSNISRISRFSTISLIVWISLAHFQQANSLAKMGRFSGFSAFGREIKSWVSLVFLGKARKSQRKEGQGKPGVSQSGGGRFLFYFFGKAPDCVPDPF